MPTALRQLDDRVRRAVIGVAALALAALGVQPCALAGTAAPAPAAEAQQVQHAHHAHHAFHGAGQPPAAEKVPTAAPAHCDGGGCAYAMAVQPPSPAAGAAADLPVKPIVLAAPGYTLPPLTRSTDRRFTEYRSPPLPTSPILEHRVLRI